MAVIGIGVAFIACAGAVYGWGGSENVIGILLPISLVVGGLSAVILGVTVTVAAHVMLSAQHKVNIRLPKEITQLHSLLANLECSVEPSPSVKQRVVISRKIDAAISEIFDKFIEREVTPWYSQLVSDTSPSIDTMKNVLWFSTTVVHERLAAVDHVGFLTGGVIMGLTKHLERIRIAEAAGEARGERGIFHLVPQLSSPVSERNFLRVVAEFLITKVLPPEYYKCTPLRVLLKELITCRVLEPMIDRVCDPIWINQQLVSYLRQQQVAEELHNRTYHYAASYEDFITLIHDSADVNDLKHLRRNIINEIMQATAINNLKKAKGVDTSRDTTPQGTGKGDLLQARNLKRYINQLTYAKAQCERRIAALTASKDGCSSATGSASGDSETGNECNVLQDGHPLSQSLQNLPGRKILMFQVILESAFARRYFGIYLDEIGEGSLLSFWSAVQELRHSEKKLHYQHGMEIYHAYLSPQPPSVKVDRVYLRGVEAFLLGNRGPEVLYEIAEDVERTLEDRHYTGFLVSSTYHAMLVQATNQGVDFMTEAIEEGMTCGGDGSGSSDSLEPVILQLSDHSTYARNKLAHLRERLNNKLLALQAIQQSNKAEPKVIKHLETEIDNLRNDHKQLEVHVDRTGLWSDNIGQWRVCVQGVQTGEEKDCTTLALLVYLASESSKVTSSLEYNMVASSSSSIGSGASVSGVDTSNNMNIPLNGWVIVRKASQLIDLHRKFCQIAPQIKSVEMPSFQNKIFNKLSDKNHLEKVRSTSQHYFSVIMNDERLSSSEVMYAFLSPSPEHLKRTGILPKKSKFSFSTLFKGSDCKVDNEEEEIGSLMMDVGESTTESVDGGKDSIAEPMFTFLEELCELRGASKWLRKTLVSFVQITYGKTITRHVRETIQSLLSESMILYYLRSVRDTLWPTEEELSTPPVLQPTEEEVLRTRLEARDQVLNNIPVLLCTLVGQQNARRGAIRLFNTLQHHALNKNLFYILMEDSLKAIFPELERRLQTSY